MEKKSSKTNANDPSNEEHAPYPDPGASNASATAEHF
jgi:hypothetical protein